MTRLIPLCLAVTASVTLLAEETAKPQPHGMVSLNGLITGSASLDPEHDEQHRLLCSGCDPDTGLQFGNASVGVALFYWANDTEVFQFSVGGKATRYQWDSNPYYDQHTFPEAWIQVAAQTTAWENWTWRSLVSVNASTDSGDIPRYAWLQGVLWGRYEWNNKLGVHVGALSLAGMRYGRVLPILGFDLELPWHWNLRLIFPLEYSLTQQVNEKFRYGIAGRTFFGRNSFTSNCMPCFCVTCCAEDPCPSRCDGTAYCCDSDVDCCSGNSCNTCEPCVPVEQSYNLTRGYIEYTNFGLEAMMNWWPFFFTELTAAVGCTTTATLKLTDSRDELPIYRYFNPTAYAQIALNVYF